MAVDSLDRRHALQEVDGDAPGLDIDGEAFCRRIACSEIAKSGTEGDRSFPDKTLREVVHDPSPCRRYGDDGPVEPEIVDRKFVCIDGPFDGSLIGPAADKKAPAKPAGSDARKKIRHFEAVEARREGSSQVGGTKVEGMLEEFGNIDVSARRLEEEGPLHQFQIAVEREMEIGIDGQSCT